MTACASLTLMALLAVGQPSVQGVVVDPAAAPVPNAVVTPIGSTAGARSGTDGTFSLAVASATRFDVVVTAAGFAERRLTIVPNGESVVRIVLHPAGIRETVTVSAERNVRLTAPASVTVLDSSTIAAAPSLTLDDQLRSVPGFSLFRRASSRVANPTTQGVTLRGMAASGPSRTVVLLDGVPLTESFGGWVQWSRLPMAAIERVEVARGGASDLHGGDAVGGAITVDSARSGLRVFMDGGSQGTARVSAFAGRAFGGGGVTASAERFTTDGYVTVAPEARGSIDTRAAARHTSLYGGFDAGGGTRSRMELRGGYSAERRRNGTPFQVNATTTRSASGRVSAVLGAGHASARVFGASTDYDQTFSAVFADRTGERPTSAQRVDASSAGGTLDWLQPWGRGVALVAFSAREVRATLNDRSLAQAVTTVSTTEATQRTGAVTSQLSLPLTARLALSAGLRIEAWRTHRGGEEGTSDVGLGPRASLVFQRTPAVSFRASLQSGYRYPTINELYRDFRAGNTVTRANASLAPERSLGTEGSVLLRRHGATARVSAYWMWLDDAIVNVTLEADEAAILRQRQNASGIESRGVEIEADLRVRRYVTLTAASALLDSTFTRGGLAGLRVPQVPRVHASVGVRAAAGRGSLTLDWRVIGRQFDDDRNVLALRRSSMIDARAAWRAARGIELFAALENGFDDEQEVGRTPLRTIGLPRTVRAGLRLLR